KGGLLAELRRRVLPVAALTDCQLERVLGPRAVTQGDRHDCDQPDCRLMRFHESSGRSCHYRSVREADARGVRFDLALPTRFAGSFPIGPAIVKWSVRCLRCRSTESGTKQDE